MDKKKSNILMMVGATIICLGSFALIYIVSSSMNKPKTSVAEVNQYETSDTLADFTYEETESEDAIDYSSPFFDATEDYDYDNMPHAYINEIETYDDIFTLEALSRINDTTAEFLNEHGYGGTQFLTIIHERSIREKGYPCIYCYLDDYPDVIIEIRYNLENMVFEINFAQ